MVAFFTLGALGYAAATVFNGIVVVYGRSITTAATLGIELI